MGIRRNTFCDKMAIIVLFCFIYECLIRFLYSHLSKVKKNVITILTNKQKKYKKRIPITVIYIQSYSISLFQKI